MMNQDERIAYLKKLGSNIQTAREEKGMTQSDLANSAGYTTNNCRSTMSKIEHGKNDLPVTKLKMIADALSLSPAELLPKEATEYAAPTLLAAHAHDGADPEAIQADLDIMADDSEWE